MKTTNTNAFANIDLNEVFKNAPHVSIEDLDRYDAEIDEIVTRPIDEDEVPRDIRENASKGSFEIGGKAKATIRKAADINRRIIDNANIADFILSLISSIICLVYTSTVEKKWKFDKHNKFVNFIFTGCTKPEQLKILAPIIKAYNIFCIVAITPFTIAAIIKKLRK